MTLPVPLTRLCFHVTVAQISSRAPCTGTLTGRVGVPLSASGRGLNFRGPRRLGAAAVLTIAPQPQVSDARKLRCVGPGRRCRRQPERQCQWPGPGAPARGADFGRYDRRARYPNFKLKPSSPLAGCLTCHWSACERPGHWHWQVRCHWQVRSESESLAGILLGQDLRVRYHFTYYSARI